MCPACLTTTALIVAGTTSAGGLTAFVVTRLRARFGGTLPPFCSSATGRLRACGRVLQMHSGSGGEIGPHRRQGVVKACSTHPPHTFGWIACLDRLASYVAAA